MAGQAGSAELRGFLEVSHIDPARLPASSSEPVPYRVEQEFRRVGDVIVTRGRVAIGEQVSLPTLGLLSLAGVLPENAQSRVDTFLEAADAPSVSSGSASLETTEFLRDQAARGPKVVKWSPGLTPGRYLFAIRSGGLDIGDMARLLADAGFLGQAWVDAGCLEQGWFVLTEGTPGQLGPTTPVYQFRLAGRGLKVLGRTLESVDVVGRGRGRLPPGAGCAGY